VRERKPLDAPDFYPSDPDFWCAFDDGDVKVIGDEPGNTDNDPDPSDKAIPQG
jgi:hypothetical protein